MLKKIQGGWTTGFTNATTLGEKDGALHVMIYPVRKLLEVFLFYFVSKQFKIWLKVKSPSLDRLLLCSEDLSIMLCPKIPTSQYDDFRCKVFWVTYPQQSLFPQR